MFIPPENIKHQFEANSQPEAKISLKASHLLIAHEIASEIFNEETNIYAVYYPNRKTLMLAPISDTIFKQLHKANQHMLKDRNLKGDKTVALHELLIDNQIDSQDRQLEYEVQSELGVLSVKL